ncbi:unnamed protein product [Polarella glacialis]|uniref:Uncharacterized protein n=1 Tax=Polarella glacialis TaxID=89957 RepID=A0A813GRV9_POLGL|nr:unnamed protein product [Polarella glacialis]
MAFQRPLAGDAGNPVVQVSSSEEEEGDPYVQEILADGSWVKDGGRAAVEDEVRLACDGSWSVAVPSRGAASRQDVVVPSDDSCDSDFEASGLKSDVGSEYFEFRGPRPRRESAGVKMDEKHKKDQKDRKSEAHDGEVENTQENTPDDQRNNKEAHAKKARNEAGPEIAELEDAPAGHIAYEAVKELPAHEWPYAYFIFRRSDDETIRLQATEKQAGSMAHAAKICRLCYMRLAAGNSRSEAFAYRSELYHRITPSKCRTPSNFKPQSSMPVNKEQNTIDGHTSGARDQDEPQFSELMAPAQVAFCSEVSGLSAAKVARSVYTFLTTQVQASISKVKQEKFSMKADVFDQSGGFLMHCLMKARVFATELPGQLVVECSDGAVVMQSLLVTSFTRLRSDSDYTTLHPAGKLQLAAAMASACNWPAVASSLWSQGYAAVSSSAAVHWEDAASAETVAAALAACEDFFLDAQTGAALAKEQRVPSRHPVFTGLCLQGLGYLPRTLQCGRKQFHSIVGARDVAPWPSASELQRRGFCEAFVAAEAILQDAALAALRATSPGCVEEWAEEIAQKGDPSVCDAFLYPGLLAARAMSSAADVATTMDAHLDPGFLTLKLVNRRQRGIQLQAANGDWLDAEGPEMCIAPCDSDRRDGHEFDPEEAVLLLFAGERLDTLTEGGIRAVPHRVAATEEARLSFVFELRDHAC